MFHLWHLLVATYISPPSCQAHAYPKLQIGDFDSVRTCLNIFIHYHQGIPVTGPGKVGSSKSSESLCRGRTWLILMEHQAVVSDRHLYLNLVSKTNDSKLRLYSLASSRIANSYTLSVNQSWTKKKFARRKACQNKYT